MKTTSLTFQTVLIVIFMVFVVVSLLFRSVEFLWTIVALAVIYTSKLLVLLLCLMFFFFATGIALCLRTFWLESLDVKANAGSRGCDKKNVQDGCLRPWRNLTMIEDFSGSWKDGLQAKKPSSASSMFQSNMI